MGVRSIVPPQAATRDLSLFRLTAGVLLGVLSAVLFIFAFQPYSVWPFAFVALVPMLLAEQRILPERWSGLSRAVTLGVWLTVFLSSVFGFGQIFIVFLIITAVVGLISIISSPATRRFHNRTQMRWFILHGAVDLAGIELIRSFIPPLNTHAFWAQTAYSQPWLIQPIAVFGMYGLTVVWLAFNYGLALTAIAWFDRDRQWDDNITPVRFSFAWRGLGIAAAVLAAWIAMSLIQVNTVSLGEPVRVAAVQHGFARAGHLEMETEAERLVALTAQTRLAAADGARLVVWPELGVGFDPQVKHTAELRALAAETGAYILIGYGVVTPDDAWRNEAVLLGPDGAFFDVYGKNFATKPGEPDIVTAGSYPVWDTELGPLSTIICNDVNYPQTTRALARNGAGLVMVPTLETAAPGLGWEQRVQSVLRAVDSRVAVVKADVAGIHMIIDPVGRIVAQTEMAAGEPGYLAADVPLGNGNAFQTVAGDWIGWMALVGMVGFTVVINRKPRL